MRKVIATVVVAAAFGGLSAQPANSADLGVHKAPSPAYAAPVFNWTGFYIGANGGYGNCGSCDIRIDGAFVGGQIGYNWQTGPVVFGIEADGEASWIGRTETLFGLSTEARNRAFGTVRGRVGYAIDRALLYATGGWAWSNNRFSATMLGVTISESKTHDGWVVGGGLEYALDRNWTIKGEYQYLNFRSQDYSFGTPFVFPSGELMVHTGRIGVNYLFH
jgi:outer membrane immunogenic protein